MLSLKSQRLTHLVRWFDHSMIWQTIEAIVVRAEHIFLLRDASIWISSSDIYSLHKALHSAMIAIVVTKGIETVEYFLSSYNIWSRSFIWHPGINLDFSLSKVPSELWSCELRFSFKNRNDLITLLHLRAYIFKHFLLDHFSQFLKNILDCFVGHLLWSILSRIKWKINERLPFFLSYSYDWWHYLGYVL